MYVRFNNKMAAATFYITRVYVISTTALYAINLYERHTQYAEYAAFFTSVFWSPSCIVVSGAVAIRIHVSVNLFSRRNCNSSLGTLKAALGILLASHMYYMIT